MRQVNQPVSRLIQLAYLSIATLLLFFTFKYPPLADYIEWVYQSFIFSDLMHGNSDSLFYLRDYPVPYVLVQFIMGSFNPMMGPVWAGKATLVVYLVLGGWLSKTFVERYELNGVLAYPLLLSCIILNSSFWSGYINYQFGLLVLMAYLSLSEEWQDKTWINLLFSILAFTSHGFCLLAFGVIAGIRACTQGWRAIVLFSLACLPAFTLTLWYMKVHNNDTMQAMDAPAAYLSMKFWAYKIYTLTKAGPYQNFMLGAVSDIDRSPALYYFGVATNVLIGGLLVALHIKVLRRFSNPKTLHLSIAATIFALAYIFAPSLAVQIVNPGERILYPELLCVFAVALPCTSPLRESRLSKYFAGHIYALLIASMVSLMMATHQQGYQHHSLDAFKEVQKNYTRILYWHRPYQFEERFEHMEKAYQSNSNPTLPIIFPTSLIGNKH
ncbi:hypothetical protein [Aquabacterium sp.]|uniref:hypothetical protein n=1 Tax=Aquabacterium sp. TaxID=1872578 RepID=UPI00248810AF|nr:hypothetical protein [Aquabacterium sp.]MDI1259292.1 hypothetical protein [Aquabacterium sp.]